MSESITLDYRYFVVTDIGDQNKIPLKGFNDLSDAKREMIRGAGINGFVASRVVDSQTTETRYSISVAPTHQSYLDMLELFDTSVPLVAKTVTQVTGYPLSASSAYRLARGEGKPSMFAFVNFALRMALIKDI